MSNAHLLKIPFGIMVNLYAAYITLDNRLCNMVEHSFGFNKALLNVSSLPFFQLNISTLDTRNLRNLFNDLSEEDAFPHVEGFCLETNCSLPFNSWTSLKRSSGEKPLI